MTKISMLRSHSGTKCSQGSLRSLQYWTHLSVMAANRASTPVCPPASSKTIRITKLLETKYRPAPRCQLWKMSGLKLKGSKPGRPGNVAHGETESHGARAAAECIVLSHVALPRKSSKGKPSKPAKHKWHTPAACIVLSPLLGARRKWRSKWAEAIKNGQSPFIPTTAKRRVTLPRGNWSARPCHSKKSRSPAIKPIASSKAVGWSVISFNAAKDSHLVRTSISSSGSELCSFDQTKMIQAKKLELQSWAKKANSGITSIIIHPDPEAGFWVKKRTLERRKIVVATLKLWGGAVVGRLGKIKVPKAQRTKTQLGSKTAKSRLPSFRFNLWASSWRYNGCWRDLDVPLPRTGWKESSISGSFFLPQSPKARGTSTQQTARWQLWNLSTVRALLPSSPCNLIGTVNFSSSRDRMPKTLCSGNKAL